LRNHVRPRLHPKHDRAALSNIPLGLCRRVSGDLGRKNYLGKSIGIKLRYDDFQTVTPRDVTLEEATADPESIELQHEHVFSG
jgi:DNA polymerase IV